MKYPPSTIGHDDQICWIGLFGCADFPSANVLSYSAGKLRWNTGVIAHHLYVKDEGFFFFSIENTIFMLQLMRLHNAIQLTSSHNLHQSQHGCIAQGQMFLQPNFFLPDWQLLLRKGFSALSGQIETLWSLNSKYLSNCNTENAREDFMLSWWSGY